MDIQKLIQDEEIQLKRLNEVITDSIEEEKFLSEKILELEEDRNILWSQRVADTVASFGGSWIFIISFLVLMVIWIIANTVWLSQGSAFDPYPFILLNLILSCLAALQAPIIMMSQNRQEEKDRRRSRSDFLINMKAEMEIRSLHKKIDLLMAEQMQHLFKIQQLQIDLIESIKNNLQR